MYHQEMKLYAPLSAVLLDRDGTIIHDCHYLSDPAGVALLPHAAEGLRLLQDAGLPLILVSNQSGIGRGYFSAGDAARVHARLEALLRKQGVRLAAAYHCPHTPEDHCTCRKPAAGMVLRAAQDLHFDPARAAVIGDKPCDVRLARAVGALALLVGTAREADCPMPDFMACDLLDAAHWLLTQET